MPDIDTLTPEQFANLEASLANQAGRLQLVSRISADNPDNWQHVETPLDICREMLDVVPQEAESWVVFFAMEFLEILVKERKVKPDNVLFVADNQLEADVAGHGKMYGIKSVVYGRQPVTVESIKAKIGEANMKFGKLAVIGNPPYQCPAEAVPGSSMDPDRLRAKPIYNLFIEAIIDGLAPDWLTFVVPSRWMVGGLGLDKFRERMKNDRRMKRIVHFPGSFSVFPSVKIDGGVNYFLWQKDYNGKCEFAVGNTTTERYLNEEDIILQDNNVVGILAKVKAVSSKWVSQLCFSKRPFGLSSNFLDFKTAGVKCVKRGHEEKLVDPAAFSDIHGLIGKWKTCIGEAYGEAGAETYKVLSKPFVLPPNTICTETYVVVAVFDKEAEAVNFMSYMRTKFFRFMLLTRKNTQHLDKDKFAFVPDMKDYTAPWTDAELAKRFKLTRQEVAYIDSKIKAL